MDKRRTIRLGNTLLAAAGALLLTFEWLFVYWADQLYLNSNQFLLIIGFFWFINLGFIVAVGSGYAERFKDPSLTTAQMYWASSCCLLTLTVFREYKEMVYFLLFVIMVFGVFRFRSRAFNVFALYVVIAHALQSLYVFKFQSHNVALYEPIVIWFSLACSVLILTMLCLSMTKLRQRLRDKNKELQAAIETKGQFLANMSHEIRTPMNGVIGMLEILDNSNLDKSQKKYLNIARTSGRTLVGLINDILDFSKIDAGRLVLDKANFSFKESIFILGSGFYFLAKQKNIELVLDIDPALPNQVCGDEIRVCQIFNNLIGNALKFTELGTIHVRFRVEDSAPHDEAGELNFVCEVRDTGIGINQSSLAKIFETFSQADGSDTRKFGGTGLGLSIVKQLCQLMGGDVSVESKVGEGSSFQFNFIMNKAFGANLLKPTHMLAGHKILFIEDGDCYNDAFADYVKFLGGAFRRCSSQELQLNKLIDDVQSDKLSMLIIHPWIFRDDFEQVVEMLSKLPAFNQIPILIVGEFQANKRQSPNISIIDKPVNFSSFELSIVNALNKDTSRDKNKLNGLNKTKDELESPNANAESRHAKKGEKMSSVLLVEDNATNQEVASMLLEDIGLTVLIADDGQKALDVLGGEHDIKLVFMDCQMPNMDGYTATREIRKGTAGADNSEIPIVAMTANALAGDREKCLEAGMNDYITKPISFVALEQMVEQWMSP